MVVEKELSDGSAGTLIERLIELAPMRGVCYHSRGNKFFVEVPLDKILVDRLDTSTIPRN
jgi:hypothetical protein